MCVCVCARARARVPRLLYPFTCQWRVDVWVLRVLAVVGSAAVNMGGLHGSFRMRDFSR